MIQISKRKKETGVIFYALTFPIVLALFIVLGLAGVLRLGAKQGAFDRTSLLSAPIVLGEDSEDSEDSEDDSSDDSKDEEDDRDEDREDSEDRSDEDSPDSSDDSDDDDSPRPVLYGSDDDSDEDEDSAEELEDELDNEDEDIDDEQETTQTIINADGSRTVIVRKVEGNEIKVTATTYSATGAIIKQEKFEQDESGQQEVKIVNYSLTGEQASKLELQTDDGKLKIEMKGAGSEDSKLTYNPLFNQLSIEGETEDSGEVKIRVKKDHFELEHEGHGVQLNFPISVDPATGRVFITTPGGKEIELSELPDVVVAKAKLEGADDVQSVNLEESEDSEDEFEYVVSGVKEEKVLGLVPVQIPAEFVYSLQNSAIVEIRESFLMKILDFLSF